MVLAFPLVAFSVPAFASFLIASFGSGLLCCCSCLVFSSLSVCLHLLLEDLGCHTLLGPILLTLDFFLLVLENVLGHLSNLRLSLKDIVFRVYACEHVKLILDLLSELFKTSLAISGTLHCVFVIVSKIHHHLAQLSVPNI